MLAQQGTEDHRHMSHLKTGGSIVLHLCLLNGQKKQLLEFPKYVEVLQECPKASFHPSNLHSTLD